MNQYDNFIEGLLDILCGIGAVSEADREELKDEFEGHEATYFEDYLIDEGLVDKEKLLYALKEYYGVEAVDVLGEMFDHKLLRMFPKDVLLRNCCIPYQHEGPLMVIITNNPRNEDLDVLLGEYASYDFEFFVGIPRHIDMMIKEFYQDELYEDDYEENIEHAELDREIIEIDEVEFDEEN